ncbi:unnamed protein product [Larinioides sclopetarius]|uniref:Uncharacterized protein n=1 Tax=Larinioides sclopetarius TaxID=280406 RepID=A0AAV2AHV0_9ARAC
MAASIEDADARSKDSKTTAIRGHRSSSSSYWMKAVLNPCFDSSICKRPKRRAAINDRWECEVTLEGTLKRASRWSHRMNINEGRSTRGKGRRWPKKTVMAT